MALFYMFYTGAVVSAFFRHYKLTWSQKKFAREMWHKIAALKLWPHSAIEIRLLLLFCYCYINCMAAKRF